MFKKNTFELVWTPILTKHLCRIAKKIGGQGIRLNITNIFYAFPFDICQIGFGPNLIPKYSFRGPKTPFSGVQMGKIFSSPIPFFHRLGVTLKVWAESDLVEFLPFLKSIFGSGGIKFFIPNFDPLLGLAYPKN